LGLEFCGNENIQRDLIVNVDRSSCTVKPTLVNF